MWLVCVVGCMGACELGWTRKRGAGQPIPPRHVCTTSLLQQHSSQTDPPHLFIFAYKPAFSSPARISLPTTFLLPSSRPAEDGRKDLEAAVQKLTDEYVKQIEGLIKSKGDELTKV